MSERHLPVTDALLRTWPLPSLAQSDGKEDRGRVIVIGGSSQIPGAALLAAEAVLRAGAGKLHIVTSQNCQAAIGIAVPEAKVSAAREDRTGNLESLDERLAKELASADAILLGPGLESCASSFRLARQVSQGCASPLVLDAGALENFQEAPPTDKGRIITPHFGEMARLLGRPIGEIQQAPASLALQLARNTGTVVVLKSPTTFIAAPDGQCWVHVKGSVGLGTSGSGDVLAGLITGLVARGASLTQAAVWGVRLHGKAGELLSNRSGPVGFLAREISPQVPAILRQLDA
jgi:hydroxyethylthiazole kinase-like uncharacterized protein yjeF